MKKRVISIVAVIVALAAVFTFVAAARAASARPTLTFTGTTANCSVTCTGNDSSDTIKVSMTLRENGTPVAGWNGSGTDYVTLAKTYAAKSGATYTLVVNYSINGVAQAATSTTKTCP